MKLVDKIRNYIPGNQQEEFDKEIMLDLITQLIARLNEINDGSFVIEDLETERLKKL